MLEILDVVRKEYSIDANRIYVAGQSNGGIGAWGLITKKPGVFAAAIPLCGAGNTSLASRGAKTAVWAFHGEKDDVISSDYSRKMIAAMKKRRRQSPLYRIQRPRPRDLGNRVQGAGTRRVALRAKTEVKSGTASQFRVDALTFARRLRIANQVANLGCESP